MSIVISAICPKCSKRPLKYTGEIVKDNNIEKYKHICVCGNIENLQKIYPLKVDNPKVQKIVLNGLAKES